MFDIERWQEIFDTIRKNKLRTFLTGLSVASGIFILVILLGFGQGMQNGIAHEFEEDASNRIGIWTNETTIAHKGLNPGRYIQLRNGDQDFIMAKYFDNLEFKSPRKSISNVSVNYKKETLTYRVQGVLPDFQFIENQYISEGRYLNQNDQDGVAKVVVISNKIKREVVKSGENPLDEYINISGIQFKIIGVYGDMGGEREEERIFMPLSTAQRVFNGADRLGALYYTLKLAASFDETVVASVRFTSVLKKELQSKHSVAPEDGNAIKLFNTLEESKRYFSLIGNINFFFWFVGICTIIAGVVGVGNIMLIVVKERTREIGIRKALGAKPWSIIGMILHESIFVTAISGCAGLILSMGLLEIFGPYIEVDYIINPSVSFNVAIATVGVLVFAGAVAGFFPALRAVRIHTIDALRDE